MTALETAVVAAYACWLAASIVRQFRWTPSQVLARLDVARLIPDWWLFANPTRHDYQILCQFVLADGRRTEWQEVRLYPDRPRGAWLWHPEMLELVALNGAIRQMMLARDEAARRALSGLPSYQWFLSRVAEASSLAGAVQVQCLVRGARAYDPAGRPVVAFLSDVSSLPERAP